MLPPELERRISAFERPLDPDGLPSDFDRASWVWIILLGIALPVVLLGLGWWWA